MKNKHIAIAIVVILVIILIVVMVMRYRSTQIAEESAVNSNMKAFLLVIRYAEGTNGPDGYRTMFTGRLFDNGFTDHPRITNCAGSLCSTAAGAYQFLSSTWDYLRVRLSLPDFSPANQDKAAIELIREKGALNDVLEGRFETAITKVNRVWASLPGAPYGQPTKTMAELKNVYSNYNGNLA
jgi:lysozyme